MFHALSIRAFLVRRSVGFAMLASVLSLGHGVAFGQVTSTATSVTLTATLGETLSITATPGSVSFTLVQGGIATGSSAVAVHTTWLLLPTRANLYLDGYFAAAASALTDGNATPDLIPTSAVLGQVPTGSPTAFTAFTQNTALGPNGAGLLLFTQAMTALNRAGARTDNLSLEINLAALPQLPAGSYTGTLTLQAQAL
jgi:hypothetical protein